MRVSVPAENIRVSIRRFLLAVLPPGVEVVVGQVNRVSPPTSPNFVTFAPTSRIRLATTESEYTDTIVTGSITSKTLRVTDVVRGSVLLGAPVFAEGVADGTFITARNADGSYAVSIEQTVEAGTLYLGTAEHMQRTQATYQLDIYGPDSGDLAQIVATMARSSAGVSMFRDFDLGVALLYSGDPRQMPLITGEIQYQERWTFDIVLQVNPVVIGPQQFADAVSVTLIPVL